MYTYVDVILYALHHCYIQSHNILYTLFYDIKQQLILHFVYSWIVYMLRERGGKYITHINQM